MNQTTNNANLILAGHYLEVGQPEKALQALERPDAEQLDKPYYWFLRGRAYYQQDRYGQASYAAHKGLALAPNAIFLLYLRYSIASKQGNLAAAEVAILQALRQAPEDPQLLCAYALLVARGGQLEKAEQLLDVAQHADPQYPGIARAKMILAYLRGDDKEAIATGKSALAADPDDIFGHYMVGHALQAQGRTGEAERFINTAARLDPIDSAVTEAARDARFRNHWLLLPLRPVRRFGPVPVWTAAVGIMLLLSVLGFNQMLLVFAVAWIVYVVYSWVVPPLFARWFRRRYRTLRG